MKLLIGLVGENGSGKETFTNFLEQIAKNKKISRIRSSDVLKKTLELWDLPSTRENLQNLPIIMNKQFGEGTLTHAVYKRIENDSSDIVVFDGVRWQTDVEMIKKFPKNFIVYITADEKLRFERIKMRKEKKGEESTTFEQFLKEEKARTEVFIKGIGEKADLKIVNNGTFEELRAQIEVFYNKYLLPNL